MNKSMAAYITVTFLAAFSASDEVCADAAGDRLLSEMDAALNRAATLTQEYEVVIQEPGQEEGKLKMSVLTKGDKRLYEFLAPVDMKGTKMLSLSPAQIYIFLPAFGRVRRITTPAAFIGALSPDDMATTSYSSTYTGQITSETATERKLVATPKANQTTTHSKIEFLVSRDKTLPLDIKYFNAAGANDRTETRSRYSCNGAVCSPGEVKITDNTKGNWTRLIRISWKVNETIADDVFSTRSLGAK
jgi:hypothetical protein